jgi:hypothetical protein
VIREVALEAVGVALRVVYKLLVGNQESLPQSRDDYIIILV